VGHEAEKKQNQENEEQNLGDSRCGEGYYSEAEKSGDQSNDKKN
jgi:hypothetical protein